MEERTKPKVSIVIPTFNVEDFIDECLESVCRQTLKDIEIICVNDGSTDSSLDIIKKYAADDDRIVIIDKQNEGYGKGVNDGFDAATGEYFAIVEPDDWIPLEMYEDLYGIASADNLDVVKGDFYEVETDEITGNQRMEYCRLFYSDELYGRVFSPSDRPTTPIDGGRIATWSGIYSIDFLKRNNIRHNETPGASYQDAGFYWQVITHAKKAQYINKAYYRHRYDSPNSSSNNRGKIYAVNKEYKFIKERLMADPDETLWDRFKGSYSIKKYGGYLWNILRIDPELRREFVEVISEEYRAADLNGEIDWTLMTDIEKRNVSLLINDSDLYYEKFGNPKPVLSEAEQLKKLKKDNKELRRELKRIKKSNSYKIGRKITSPIRACKKVVKRG